MAKGRKALAEDMKRRDEEDRRRAEQAQQQFQQQLTVAQAPSPAETQSEKDRAGYFKWRDEGDFTKPPPTLIGMSYGPSSERRRQLERSAVPTGIFGMGGAYANPTALALAGQNMADTNAQRDAEAYQGAIGAEDLYQRTGNSQSLMTQDFARKMGLLSSTGGMSQFAANNSLNASQNRINTTPQSILPMLLSGLLQGGAAFATGGMSSLMGPAIGAAAGGLGSAMGRG